MANEERNHLCLDWSQEASLSLCHSQCQSLKDESRKVPIPSWQWNKWNNCGNWWRGRQKRRDTETEMKKGNGQAFTGNKGLWFLANCSLMICISTFPPGFGSVQNQHSFCQISRWQHLSSYWYRQVFVLPVSWYWYQSFKLTNGILRSDWCVRATSQQQQILLKMLLIKPTGTWCGQKTWEGT